MLLLWITKNNRWVVKASERLLCWLYIRVFSLNFLKIVLSFRLLLGFSHIPRQNTLCYKYAFQYEQVLLRESLKNLEKHQLSPTKCLKTNIFNQNNLRKEPYPVRRRILLFIKALNIVPLEKS